MARRRSAPAAVALDQYSRLRRTNELLIVSPDDEFYASVVDLPKVRYVYLTPLDASKTSEFFYRLGHDCERPRVLFTGPNASGV